MSNEHDCNGAWEDCPGCRDDAAELKALRAKYAGVPLPEKTIFLEYRLELSPEAHERLQNQAAKWWPGWRVVILEDGMKVSSIHGNPDTLRKSLASTD